MRRYITVHGLVEHENSNSSVCLALYKLEEPGFITLWLGFSDNSQTLDKFILIVVYDTRGMQTDSV